MVARVLGITFVFQAAGQKRDKDKKKYNGGTKVSSKFLCFLLIALVTFCSQELGYMVTLASNNTGKYTLFWSVGTEVEIRIEALSI